MMNRFQRIVGFCLVGLINSTFAAGGSHVPLEVAKTELCDKASLQRGAGLYMNYCAGCHSLKYARYNQVAQDIGITSKTGEVIDSIVSLHFNHVTDNNNDPILNAMDAKDAEAWFGVAPPDLSLEIKAKGRDWVYTYMKTFYEDPSRPFGVNNMVFPDVGMPHVLAHLQGTQAAVESTLPNGNSEVVGVKLVSEGQLSSDEYDQAILDLVNFLEYVSEPHQLKRKQLGVWVLMFLTVFTLFAYLTKREYWKDVH